MLYGAGLSGPIRVLYIDDDPGLAVLVRKALVQRGHQVEHVVSGDEGLERLASGEIDVIALDHSLAGETGLDVLGRLGPRDERPPVVYVTGSSDARTAIEAIRAGADEYVIKDMCGEFYELLIVAVEQVLERARFKRAQKQNEAEVRAARDRAEVLLREVNHRVANSLGLVAALVRMQSYALSDPACQQALKETQTRISAVAGVHRHLYVSGTVGLVEIDDYLANLVAELQDSLRGPEHDYPIRLTADKFTVKTDKAVSLGVIVGELVTNAYKYAYEPGVAGEVRLTIRRLDADRAVLTVEDDGDGYDGEAPSRGTGLGAKILAAMAQTLSADLQQKIDVCGVRTTLEFPL